MTQGLFVAIGVGSVVAAATGLEARFLRAQILITLVADYVHEGRTSIEKHWHLLLITAK